MTTLLNENRKPLDIYQQDEEDDLEIEDQVEVENANYDFDMDDMGQEEDGGEEDDFLDEDTKMRMEQELLFLTQGVGSIKNINNFDVYVKHP